MKEQSSHYYERTKDGTIIPRYEIERADGKGLRGVNLKDARAHGWLPSVSTILRVLSRPGLENWKAQQLLQASLTLPRLPDEPLDEYAARVTQDAEAHSEKARDFGTRIHAAIELWLKEKRYDEPAAGDYLGSFFQWAEKEITAVHGSEFYVSSPIGYAGRVDLHCDLRGIGEAVIDFKARAVKTDSKGIKQPKFWPEDSLQLIAYAHPVNPDKWPALVSIVIDSSEPGPVFVHQWPDPDKLWEVWQHIVAVWQWHNSYYPSL